MEKLQKKKENQSDLHFYWVVPGKFVVGEHPGSKRIEFARSNLRELLSLGVSTFIDLTEELENYEYKLAAKMEVESKEISLKFYRLPIGDRQIPLKQEMVKILDTIDDSIQKGEIVYLHCLAGIGRTGTAVGCFLVRHGLTGQVALTKIKSLRKNTTLADLVSPETPQQRDFVLNWRE